MRKLALLVFLTIALQTKACDVCGCQMGGMSLGIMPQKNSNFVGLNYNYAGFNAQIKSNSGLFDARSNDTYQRVDVVAKFNINKHFWFYGVLPYGFNTMNGSHQSVNTNGFSDPLAMVFFKALDLKPDSNDGNWYHLLNIGLGAKSPLGDYQLNDIVDDESTPSLVNPNFQLGSGSWDFLSVLSYRLKFKKIGLSTEHTFKYNTANPNDYQFGNQYNSSLNLFSWWFTKKGYSWLPFAGVYYEWADVHRQGYNQRTVSNTGGNALFANFGGKVIYQKIGFTLTAQAPLQQNFATDDITTIDGGWRWQVGVRYYFEKWRAKK